MSDFKDMSLDTILKDGDVVTITGPGEHDVLVREVNNVDTGGAAEVYIYGTRRVTLKDLVKDGRKLTRIQRSSPALPTTPGYYQSDEYPLSDGHLAYWLDDFGQWYSIKGKLTEVRMRELMPLTRLVPEVKPASTKLSDRVDPYKLGNRAGWLVKRNGSKIAEDGLDLLIAIESGELDK